MLAANDYDPGAPEGDAGSSGQYLTKKDARLMALAIVVVAALAVPVYLYVLAERHRVVSQSNLQAIGQAMNLYAEEHEGRYPPAYLVGENGTPQLIDGASVNWATIVQPLMTQRASLEDPGAQDDEATPTLPPSDDLDTILLDYGMYVARSTGRLAEISNTANTALVAESANDGARDTYDPEPFLLEDGAEVAINGFLIAYDNSNSDHTFGTSAITRLAIYGVADGDFAKEDVRTRHRGGVQVLMADGSVRQIDPREARVRDRLGEDITGIWSAVPGEGR